MALDHDWDVPQCEPEKLAEFNAKYGEDSVARVVQTRVKKDSPTGRAVCWEIIMRRPIEAEVQVFEARNSSPDPTQKARAQELLIRSILLHPSQEAFVDLLKKWPAMCKAPRMTRALFELLGWAEDQLEGK